MAVGLVLEGRSVAMLWKTPTTLTHSLPHALRWAYMMVDEAHRLKNDESALYKVRALCACPSC